MEWDHEQFCTVAEIAWLNGVSVYNGKANYYHDREAKPFAQLYAAFPPVSMIWCGSTFMIFFLFIHSLLLKLSFLINK